MFENNELAVITLALEEEDENWRSQHRRNKRM
jgi:hypothetical protein